MGSIDKYPRFIELAGTTEDPRIQLKKKPMISTKNAILMAGAIAAGLQAVSIKTTNPSAALVLVFLSTSLAYFVNPIRDPNSRDRAGDEVDEKSEDAMEGKE